MAGFLVAQTVKNLPAMQETQLSSLGQEDSPGEGNGTLLQDLASWVHKLSGCCTPI